MIRAEAREQNHDLLIAFHHLFFSCGDKQNLRRERLRGERRSARLGSTAPRSSPELNRVLREPKHHHKTCDPASVCRQTNEMSSVNISRIRSVSAFQLDRYSTVTNSIPLTAASAASFNGVWRRVSGCSSVSVNWNLKDSNRRLIFNLLGSCRAAFCPSYVSFLTSETKSTPPCARLLIYLISSTKPVRLCAGFRTLGLNHSLRRMFGRREEGTCGLLYRHIFRDLRPERPLVRTRPPAVTPLQRPE